MCVDALPAACQFVTLSKARRGSSKQYGSTYDPGVSRVGYENRWITQRPSRRLTYELDSKGHGSSQSCSPASPISEEEKL
jgi:hypothetical protein